MNRLEPLPLYPIAFALSWVLAAVIDSGVRLQTAVRVLLVVPGIAALLVLACVLALKSRSRGGVAAAALIVLLSSRDFGRLGLAVIGIVATVIAILVIRRIVRRPIRADQLTVAANLISAVLLVTIIVQGLANGSLPAWIDDLAGRPPVVSPSDPDDPDIYLILVDGYPRGDTVREVLDGDNVAFLEQLEARGFMVDPQAHSGYMYTDLVMTSLLHGRHLVDIPELDGLIGGASLPSRGRQVLNEAPLLEQLLASGYTLVANARAWDDSSVRRVHQFVEGSGLNEFERKTLLNSLPGAVWQSVDPAVRQRVMHPWVEDAFDFVRTAAAAQIGGPRFVFAHVPSPHFPIVFTADGGFADPRFGLDHPDQIRSATLAETKQAYLGQVEYLNRQLLEMLDSNVVPDDAIVIVMSDHGPEFGLDWRDGAASDLRTRFAILFATRAPEGVFEMGEQNTGVLVRVVNEVLGREIEEPVDRFFTSSATPKYATLTEIPSPWSD